MQIPTLVLSCEVLQSLLWSAAGSKGLFGVQDGNETRAGLGALHNVSPPFPCGIGIVGKADILS